MVGVAIDALKASTATLASRIERVCTDNTSFIVKSFGGVSTDNGGKGGVAW